MFRVERVYGVGEFVGFLAFIGSMYLVYWFVLGLGPRVTHAVLK